MGNWLAGCFGAHCGGCAIALPVGSGALWCPACEVAVLPSTFLSATPAGLPLVATLLFTGPVATWLSATKAGDRAPLLDPLQAAWRATTCRIAGPAHAVVVPVGPQLDRLRRRGWHLPDLLADTLRHRTHRGLQRHDRAAPRRHDRDQVPVFRWRGALTQPVILIDDVVTTGATLDAAAAVLRAAGVTVLGAACLTDARPAAIARAAQAMG